MTIGTYNTALRLLESSIQVLRAVDDRATLGHALATLGGYYAQCGDQVRARTAFAEAHAIRQQLGSLALMIIIAKFEGPATYLVGDDLTAARILEDGLAVGRQTGYIFTAELFAALGLARSRLGVSSGARQVLAEGIRWNQRITYHLARLQTLEATGLVLGAETWTDQAVQLLGAAAQERVQRGIPLPPAERAIHEVALAVARTALGEGAFAAAWAVGQTLSFAAALDEAEALLTLPAAHSRHTRVDVPAATPARPLAPLLSPAYPAGLSPREVEVLRLIAAGCANQEIAAQLSISPNTVLRHVSHIFAKTNTVNRAAAAVFALRHGLDGPGNGRQ